MITLAFKNSFYNGWFDGLFGVGITLRNFLSGQYNSIAHVEAVFDARFDKVSWSCIESDTGDDGKPVSGSRFKHIEYSHPERWQFVKWDVTDKRFPKTYRDDQEVFDLCKSIQCGYDWPGILGQALGLPTLQDEKKMFCSEGVGLLPGFTCHPSPSKLLILVTEILKKPVQA